MLSNPGGATSTLFDPQNFLGSAMSGPLLLTFQPSKPETAKVVRIRQPVTKITQRPAPKPGNDNSPPNPTASFLSVQDKRDLAFLHAEERMLELRLARSKRSREAAKDEWRAIEQKREAIFNRRLENRQDLGPSQKTTRGAYG